MTLFWISFAWLTLRLPSWRWCAWLRMQGMLRLIDVAMDNDDPNERAEIARHLREHFAGDETAMDRLTERVERWESRQW